MKAPDPLILPPHTARAAARTTVGEPSAETRTLGVAWTAEACTAASSRAAVALSVTPSTADLIAPEALTRMASSHSGQRVGWTANGSDVDARTPPAAVSMLHMSNADDVCGALKNAPTYSAWPRSAGPSLYITPTAAAETHTSSARLSVAVGAVVIPRPIASELGSPKVTYAECSVMAHVSLVDASTVVSLVDGHRLSHNRSADTSFPSESATELRGNGVSLVAKSNENGYGEGLKLGEELAVAALLADCD